MDEPARGFSCFRIITDAEVTIFTLYMQLERNPPLASKKTPRHGQPHIKPSEASTGDQNHDAAHPGAIADKNTDTFGLMAQDLPDGGRGVPETDPGKELGRMRPP